MFTKYASLENAEILGVKGSSSPIRTASLDKFSDFEDYRTEDGYLYARIRAISSRVNKNDDGWPSIELAGGEEAFNRIASKLAAPVPGGEANPEIEALRQQAMAVALQKFPGTNPEDIQAVPYEDKMIVTVYQNGQGKQFLFNPPVARTANFVIEADSNAEYGYSTFLGKPIFVDHHNSDPSKARGVIVDAKLHVDDHKTAKGHDPYYASAPDNHMPPTWVELLLEIDAKSFPKLAAAIIEGSKDPDKGIDGFSMGCFVAGTPITLADGTRKPIETIQEGDEVLTHTGKSEPVTYVMKRPHNGLVYKINTYGQAQPMILTEEHPVWTKNGWVETKDLNVNDEVLTPMPEGVGHPGSYPFARLLGYYLAEGNLGYDRKRFADGRPVTVEWNFHVDEIEQVQEVETLLEALGYRTAGPYVKNHCASIRCNSPELAQRFFDYGGIHSWGKRLHSEVMRWEIENQRAVLDAYFIGDGHQRTDRRVEAGTASKQLASQLQLLASRAGYRMTPPVEQHSPSAKETGKRPKYSMQATLVKPDPRTEVNARLDDKGLWRRITKISTQDHDGYVYNFDVEGDDSYVAADIAVHNCDVEYSICSHCSNKATSPEEYCEHVRLKGAEFPYTDKHGKTSSRKSYEDCYKIKFFEISAVFDPADETALLREIRAHTAAEKQGMEFPQEREQAQFGAPALDQNTTCPECNGQGCPQCYGTGQTDIVPEQWDHPGRIIDNTAEWGYPPRTGSMEKTAEAPPPQVDELKMPEEVDTLRKESVCPVCGSDMDEETCEVCGYTRPPEEFDNPDLTKANPDLSEQEPGQEPGQEPAPEHDETFGGPKIPEGDTTSNNPSFAHVNNDMSWEATTTYESNFTKGAPDAGDDSYFGGETGSSKKAYDSMIKEYGKDKGEEVYYATRNKKKGKESSTNPQTETPSVPNAGPATDEPKDATVTQDHSKPVTSYVRTAEDFLAATGAQRRIMPEKTAEAASGAPEAATPDKSVDTDAVGGVMESTNEDASKADAQIDVEGVGNTGTSDVAADKTESTDQGDEHSKNIEEIPTKTWGSGTGVEEQRSPVGTDVYPAEGGVTSSWEVTALDSEPYPHEDGGLGGGTTTEGVQPADPVGNPDERVDVLDAVTSPENNSGETKTWSGTDGNGVLRQQEPVTQESLEGEEIVNLNPTSSTHIFAAMKLADKEVALGLTSEDQKYDRVAELENLSPEELQAEARVIDRVKTAGLSKGLPKTAKRMPTMGRNANVEKESNEDESAEFIADSSLFLS